MFKYLDTGKVGGQRQVRTRSGRVVALMSLAFVAVIAAQAARAEVPMSQPAPVVDLAASARQAMKDKPAQLSNPKYAAAPLSEAALTSFLRGFAASPGALPVSDDLYAVAVPSGLASLQKASKIGTAPEAGTNRISDVQAGGEKITEDCGSPYEGDANAVIASFHTLALAYNATQTAPKDKAAYDAFLAAMTSSEAVLNTVPVHTADFNVKVSLPSSEAKIVPTNCGSYLNTYTNFQNTLFNAFRIANPDKFPGKLLKQPDLPFKDFAVTLSSLEYSVGNYKAAQSDALAGLKLLPSDFDLNLQYIMASLQLDQYSEVRAVAAWTFINDYEITDKQRAVLLGFMSLGALSDNDLDTAAMLVRTGLLYDSANEGLKSELDMILSHKDAVKPQK